MWGTNPSPQGEAGSWEYPPNCMHCARGRVYDESMSQLLLLISVYFLVLPMCRSFSGSFCISFIDSFPMCSCTSCVSMGGEEFRSFPCHHLGQLSSYSFILNELNKYLEISVLILNYIYYLLSRNGWEVGYMQKMSRWRVL